jgi:methyl-accepting chemotaxis protein
MNLGNMRTSLKVMLVIAVLGAVSLAIAIGGVFALYTVNDEGRQIDAAGERAASLALMTQDIMSLNRAEYSAAADPSAETVNAARSSIDENKAEFEKRLQELKAGLPEAFHPDLEAVETAYAIYIKDMSATMSVAARVAGSVELTEAQRDVVDAARISRTAADELETAADKFVARLLENGKVLSEESTRTFDFASITMIATAILGILGGVLLGSMISSKGIVQPISKIVESLKGLANGDLNTAVFGRDRTDEVGEIAATTQVFKDNLIEATRLREEQANARVAREQRQVVVNTAISRFEGVAEEIVRTLSSAATELQAASNVLSSSATEAAQQANSVAAAAEQTSANVNSVASATEELAASVREIGARAQQSHTVTRSAVDEVTTTNVMVSELEQAAQKIGDVVNLIGDIAAQTNLLALNATIEAARAGESGRGFAVVAGEVKTLAEQAARATEDISREIEGIQGVTRKSVGAMAAISTRINEISEIASTIASAVQQQSAATQEISRNVQEASAGTSEVTFNITSVSTTVSETGSAAVQVQAAASELAQQSSVLRREFETFIDVVRAA